MLVAGVAVYLYRQFKLDEPWDSRHNRTLVPRMPKVYTMPRAKAKRPGHSVYRVFTGPGTIFEGMAGVPYSAIRDGLANTILLVEAPRSVPWTKPEELLYAADQPLPELGGMFKSGFYVVYCDGQTRRIKNDFDQTRMRLAIVREDGYGFPDQPGEP